MKKNTSDGQAGCEFECLLRRSRSLCGCTPWDYPFHPRDEIKICEHVGYYCFYEAMNNLTMLQKDGDCLDCPPDCQVVEYEMVDSYAR